MIRTILFGVAFAILDVLRRREPSGKMLSPHYSILEPDTQQIVRRGPERLADGETLYVVGTTEDQQALAEKGLASERIEIVEADTWAFVSALLDSERVILRGQTHLHSYRFFGRNVARDYVLVYHGIITKAYGRHAEGSRHVSVMRRLKREFTDAYIRSDLDVQSVASEVERFFRSSAEGRHPKYFQTLGYPRFDRARELIEGEDQPSVDDETRALLDSSDTTVLYAPTHKDGEYETSLFPFEDVDPGELRSRLDANDVQLLLRLHPAEEGSGIADEFVDASRIHYVGQDVASSPIELLPDVDVLVTDYSSIYVDFLPFDQPIIFLRDRHEAFAEIRGIAFEYDRYFPGETVESMDEFFDHLSRIRETGSDEHESERAFVRAVLQPHWEADSLEALVAPEDR